MIENAEIIVLTVAGILALWILYLFVRVHLMEKFIRQIGERKSLLVALIPPTFFFLFPSVLDEVDSAVRIKYLKVCGSLYVALFLNVMLILNKGELIRILVEATG